MSDDEEGYNDDENGENGWGEDDDDLNDLDNEEPQLEEAAAAAANTTRTMIGRPATTTNTTAVVAAKEADGWEDDFDISDHHPTTEEKEDVVVDTDTPERSDRCQHHYHQDDNDKEQEEDTTGRPIILGIGLSTPVTTNKSPATNQNDGWDDFGDDEEEEVFLAKEQPATSSKDVSIGMPQPTKPSRLEVELSNYITSLSSHQHQHMNNGAVIATILAAEYNTVEKAVELNTYYTGRPALLQYTVEKEVARMDYTVVYRGDVATTTTTKMNQNGHDDDDDDDGRAAVRHLLVRAAADAAAEQYDDEEDNNTAIAICTRCANQSLLADLLQALTGDDRMIRPQYMATAVAIACRFHVDLDAAVVQAMATLRLSLPLPHGVLQRWEVADLHVLVVYEPHRPAVMFRVADVILLTPHPPQPGEQPWPTGLRECAALLEEINMTVENEHDYNNNMQQKSSAAAGNFRDRFLQNSQTVLQASAVGAVLGMKSAWQDIDAATGFGHKLKHILPNTAMMTDMVQQAEEAQKAAVADAASLPRHRPTSILGGLVRSLAKSVALPDVHVEDDDVAAAAPAPPRLYNHKPPVATAAEKPVTAAVAPIPSDPIIPRLYNRDDDMDRSATVRPSASVSAANPPLAVSTRNDDAAAIPRLYNRTDPEKIPRANAATVTTRPLVVDEQQQRLGTTPSSLAPSQQNYLSTDGRVPETAGLLIADSNSNHSADVEDVWGDDDLSLDNDGADDEIAQQNSGVVAMDDDDDGSPPAAPIGTMRHTTTAIVNRKRWVNPRLHARRSLFLLSK